MSKQTALWASLAVAIGLAAPQAHAFTYVEVDPNGPAQAWGKGIGDLNGDGKKDLVVRT